MQIETITRSKVVSSNPLDSIGLELRVAFIAVGADNGICADNFIWRRKCRELILRPAVEPLLLAHWNKLKDFEMTETQIASFSSLLTGSKQQARTRDSYGLWDGGNIRFESADRARTWWGDIQAVASNPKLQVVLPAYVFARTIVAHPYPDGNGRLGRALVHAAFAKTIGLPAPILPLAPAFYMNAAKVAAALCDLSDTGDWEAFGSVFDRVIRDAEDLVARW